MTQKELDVILKKHKKWLNGESGGECADLSEVSLNHLSLRYARLHGVDLRGADLRGADLYNAVIRDADLRDADLDYSCLPLWCGSLHAHFDDRQLRQIAYHLVCAGLHSKNASEETKRELVKILDFANGFHRAEECGILKNPFDKEDEL